MNKNNELALITGASSGIGREMAGILAKRKYDLVLVSRSGDKLDQLACEVAERNKVVVRSFVVDLAEKGSGAQVFEFIQKNNMDIDVLINNAGVGLFGEHTEIDINKLARMLQLNIGSVCEMCRLVGEDMKKRRCGKILNIASTAAYQPTPYFAAYGATKSFILNFSEALAKELEDYNVTVSCLSPGPTDTGFFTKLDEQGISNKHLDNTGRHEANVVAEIGIDMMLKGHLSKIVGRTNNFRAFSSRFAPRSMVANISKNIMKPA